MFENTTLHIWIFLIFSFNEVHIGGSHSSPPSYDMLNVFCLDANFWCITKIKSSSVVELQICGRIAANCNLIEDYWLCSCRICARDTLMFALSIPFPSFSFYRVAGHWHMGMSFFAMDSCLWYQHKLYPYPYGACIYARSGVTRVIWFMWCDSQVVSVLTKLQVYLPTYLLLETWTIFCIDASVR